MTEILTWIIFGLITANLIPLSASAFMGKRNLIRIFAAIQLLLAIILIYVSGAGL